MNKILIEQIKNLYKTATIVSFKNNVGFVPLPLKKITQKKDLIDYSLKLNHFIRSPEFAYMDKGSKRQIIDRYYVDFPEEIIKME